MALASGGMGLWGDFILGDKGDKGDQSTSALVKAAGPGATAINDALNLFMASREQAGQAFDQDAVGRQNYAAQALRFARSYALPCARIWYLKAAFNHMIYEQQMERLAPGYKDRVRKLMAKEGQTSWWGVGESSPEGVPDFNQVRQQVGPTTANLSGSPNIAARGRSQSIRQGVCPAAIVTAAQTIAAPPSTYGNNRSDAVRSRKIALKNPKARATRSRQRSLRLTVTELTCLMKWWPPSWRDSNS